MDLWEKKEERIGDIKCRIPEVDDTLELLGQVMPVFRGEEIIKRARNLTTLFFFLRLLKKNVRIG